MPALVSLTQEELDALAAEQAANQGYVAPVPTPDYVPTDPGYDLTYPGPVPQPEYIPTTQSAPAAPLPQSPSMAGPVAPPTDYSRGYESNQVQTISPASGDPSTYRSVPPPGSTYPVKEIPIDPPPFDPLSWYPQAMPDTMPKLAGEGPLGGGAPPPQHRYLPEAIQDQLYLGWAKGEGNMHARDPLTPNEPRPLVSYKRFPGQSPRDSYHLEENPIEYAPDVIHDRAASRVPPSWQGEGPTGYGSSEPSRAQILFDMERRRRERQLRGLFGGKILPSNAPYYPGGIPRE